MTARTGLIVSRAESTFTTPIVLTNVYDVATRITLQVPYFPGYGIPFPTMTGKLSVIRAYGSVKDAAATELSCIVTFDQLGAKPWLTEEMGAITTSPLGAGSWTCGIKIDELFAYSWQDADPSGTITIFLKTNNQTATITHLHFVYQE